MSATATSTTNLTPDWSTFLSHYHEYPQLGFSLDLSSTGLDVAALESLAAPLSKALQAMAELEKGSIANADEKRMVGHYWLRAPELAPTTELTDRIEETIEAQCNLYEVAMDISQRFRRS